MKNSFRYLLTVAFACLVMALVTVPTYAATITEIDEFGNSHVILDVDSAGLALSEFDVNIVDDVVIPPAPHLIAKNVPGLSDVVLDYGFPKACNFFFMDFGPKWDEEIGEGSDFGISGRYVYVFYGVYCTECDAICSDGNTGYGSNHYRNYDQLTSTKNGSDNIEDWLIEIEGCYAVASYNPDTNKVDYMASNYNEGIAYAQSLEITGVLPYSASSEYPGEYPFIVAWAHDSLSLIVLYGEYDLWPSLKWENYTWDYNWTGEHDYDNQVDLGFWNSLITGDWSADNWFTQLAMNALEGIADLVVFLQGVPNILGSIVGVLPPDFGGFLLTCLGIFGAVILIKFILHVVN